MSYTLYINGQERGLASLCPETLSVSWTSPRELRLAERAAHHEPTCGVEDNVLLSADGTAVFRGRIKSASHEGVPGAERIVYNCLGLRELARQVPVIDINTGIPRLVYNAPSDDEDYSSARAGMTVGEIIEELFTDHAGALRAAGVIAAEPALGYVPADLLTLTAVPQKIVLDSTDFDSALSAVLANQPCHRYIVDPSTQTFRFLKPSSLSAKTITYNSADRPLSALLRPTTAGRATAVLIAGPRRPVNQTLYLSDSGLTKLWDSQNEADWTWAKGHTPANHATYARVYRRFQIANSSRRELSRELASPAGLFESEPSLAPQVYRKTTGGTWARVAASFDYANGIITLAEPATTGDEYASGGAECAEDICVVCAYLDSALSVRKPSQGYEGTAYTVPDNPVEAVKYIYDENFTDSAQTLDYGVYAQGVLDSLKDIVYSGTVSLAKLDWDLASLGCRLNFAGQDDDEQQIFTGFESINAMPLGVEYDFAAGRTSVTLTTDANEYPGLFRVKELETQARRAERHRAAEPLPAPSRIGNDGEAGAAETARGVYSINKYGDSESNRITGHVELEQGGGIVISREPSTLKISAPKRGTWLWFRLFVSTTQAGETVDMISHTQWDEVKTYPVRAGQVTKVIAHTPQTLSAGSLTAKVVRFYKGEQAACPEERVNHDDFTAQISSSSNIAHSTEDDEISYSDDDLVGIRLVVSSDFAVSGGTGAFVIAGAYYEND